MTKKDMVKAIVGELGIPQAQVQEIVQRVLDGIIDTLVEEGRMELRNFGVFEVKQHKPRAARNPRTGDDMLLEGGESSAALHECAAEGRKCLCDVGQGRVNQLPAVTQGEARQVEPRKCSGASTDSGPLASLGPACMRISVLFYAAAVASPMS